MDGGTMRKWLIQFAPVIGAAIIAQSVLWEFARISPAYRRIVSPWSIRGTDTTHGTIFVTVALVLLISGLLAGWERSQESPPRYGIVAAIAAGPVILAALFTNASHSVTLGDAASIGVGALVGILATLAIRDLVAEAFPVVTTLWFSGLMMLVLGGIGAGAMLVVTGGGDNALSPPVLVAAIFVIIGVYSLLRAPRELAANRMFLFVSLAALGTIVMQAGAIRSTLIRFQADFTGTAFGYDLANVAAEYKDSQITSGWFLATFGAFFVLVTSIAMWARRRDYILSQQRARKQREAAEKSAAEIREAVAQFQAQKAAAGSTGGTGGGDSASLSPGRSAPGPPPSP
jgi:hypothetical protein